jgi:hypothetical protein
MRRTLIHLVMSVSTFASTAAARGADGLELTPLAGPTLPMPTPLGPQPFVGMGFYRPNRWDVWQNLAPDRAGFWRPRVALFGNGAFYPNGMPYPMLPIRQMDLIPYILD